MPSRSTNRVGLKRSLAGRNQFQVFLRRPDSLQRKGAPGTTCVAHPILRFAIGYAIERRCLDRTIARAEIRGLEFPEWRPAPRRGFAHCGLSLKIFRPLITAAPLSQLSCA